MACHKQRDERHPARVRQRLDGAELDQARRAAGRSADVPELVEADLAAVRVAGNVRVQVAQRFADDVAVVLALRQAREVLVRHVEIVQVARGFVRARGLRGRPDVTCP